MRSDLCTMSVHGLKITLLSWLPLACRADRAVTYQLQTNQIEYESHRCRHSKQNIRHWQLYVIVLNLMARTIIGVTHYVWTQSFKLGHSLSVPHSLQVMTREWYLMRGPY